MLVAYPRLSSIDLGLVRFIGPGLGNLLFTWARAVVEAKRQGWSVLWPTWPQVKLGPLLRREIDTRFYFGLFRPTPRYIRGLSRARMMLTWPRVREREHQGASRDALVLFEGMENYFANMLGDSDFVKRELLEIARAEHKGEPTGPNDAPIVVHVRLGDFGVANPQMLSQGHHSYRIPIEWYVAQVKALGEVLPDVRVEVFSDGSDDDVRPLLAMPRVRRAPPQSSLGDMLALSRGRVLVASGSTFSMWASYLGRMPAIWHRGQLRQRLYPENLEAEIELGANETLPASFVRQIKR